MSIDGSREDGRKMTRSAGVVGLFTLASRILGLLRDSVAAASFDKQATDAFYVAFTIPNVLRRLLAEGSLTVSFIPVFTEYRDQKGEGETRRMLRATLGATLLVLTVVTALGALASPWIVKLFAYGFVDDAGKFGLTVFLTRVMFVFILAVGLSALSMGVLNACRHFSTPALAPAILNVGQIALVLLGTTTLVGLGYPAITSLAVGVIVGGFAQLVLQLPFQRRLGYLVTPSLELAHAGVVRIAKLMLPSVFGLAIYEVNIVLARQFASFLSAGAVSYLYYSQRLIEFPMGIFAVAMATVAMPSLAAHATAGNLDKLKQTYHYALGMTFFIMLPATAGLFAVSLPITSVLFQRGHFTHEMSVATAATLQAFLAGLWAGAGVRQTAPVFYALQDTVSPVKAAVLSLASYALVAYFFHRHLGTVGLAAAVSVSSVVNFLTLLLLLRRRLGLLGLRSIARSLLLSMAASVVSGGAAWAASLLGDWSRGGVAVRNYVVLLVAVGVGAAVYIALARLFRIPELSELAASFRRRRGGGGGKPT
jgi:putative peptidoglycan lipid II flippase